LLCLLVNLAGHIPMNFYYMYNKIPHICVLKNNYLTFISTWNFRWCYLISLNTKFITVEVLEIREYFGDKTSLRSATCYL
jgi:hypothetical protein